MATMEQPRCHDPTRTGFNLELSRRRLIAAAGIAGAAMVTASLTGTADAEAAPPSPLSPDPVATPPVAGLHLQFGADAWGQGRPARKASELFEVDPEGETAGAAS